MLRQLLGVAFVLALLAGVVWRLNQGGRVRGLLAGPGGLLRCRERLRLTPQHTLHLVSAGDRAWMVACHPAGIELLAELALPSNEGGGATGPGLSARSVPA